MVCSAWEATFGAAIIMTFAQHKRTLLPVPVLTDENEKSNVTCHDPSITKLLYGTDAFIFYLECLTICFGLVEGGLSTQIHEEVVPLMFLSKVNDGGWSDFISSGVEDESPCEHTLKWTPRTEWFFSIQNMSTSTILLSIIQNSSSQCVLYILKCYPVNHSFRLMVFS